MNLGSLRLLSQVNLQKIKRNLKHLFTPKMLLRYSPTANANETTGSRLDTTKAFKFEQIR